MSYNCLDRWVAAGRGEEPCVLWEGNEESERRTLTYRQMLEEVCRLVSQLKSSTFQALPQSCAPGCSCCISFFPAPHIPAPALSWARLAAAGGVSLPPPCLLAPLQPFLPRKPLVPPPFSPHPVQLAAVRGRQARRRRQHLPAHGAGAARSHGGLTHMHPPPTHTHAHTHGEHAPLVPAHVCDTWCFWRYAQ